MSCQQLPESALQPLIQRCRGRLARAHQLHDRQGARQARQEIIVLLWAQLRASRAAQGSGGQHPR